MLSKSRVIQPETSSQGRIFQEHMVCKVVSELGYLLTLLGHPRKRISAVTLNCGSVNVPQLTEISQNQAH